MKQNVNVSWTLLKMDIKIKKMKYYETAAKKQKICDKYVIIFAIGNTNAIEFLIFMVK